MAGTRFADDLHVQLRCHGIGAVGVGGGGVGGDGIGGGGGGSTGDITDVIVHLYNLNIYDLDCWVGGGGGGAALPPAVSQMSECTLELERLWLGLLGDWMAALSSMTRALGETEDHDDF